jgi:hypothetical protein
MIVGTEIAGRKLQIIQPLSGGLVARVDDETARPGKGTTLMSKAVLGWA